MPTFDFVLAGRYRLTAPLGEGGMAAVYRGRDLRLNREVAVKVLHDDLTRDPQFLNRFKREAEIVASLSHPNIVPVYDVGDDAGTHFIVMEYVRGRTLRESLDIAETLDGEQAVAIMLRVLAALGYAHARGLVHRDVKPQNIIQTSDGTPRLADFGIAHLTDSAATRTASILGSAEYLSPEQSRGDEATPESDIYACGIVLYELLAGHPPFRGANALAIAHQHLETPPPSLASAGVEVDPGLEAAIMRALSKDPDARFPTVETFSEALESDGYGEATLIQPLRRSPLSIQRDQEEGEESASGAAKPDRIVIRRSARKAYLLGIVLAALLGAGIYLMNLSTWGAKLPQYPSAPYALLPALLAVIVILNWFYSRSRLYTMDGNAAVVQWGVIGHHRFGLPLRNVVTLELKQSPLDRVLGIGTVEVRARDQDGAERRLVMEDLPAPRRAYEDLMTLLRGASSHQQA